uniref:Regulatory protein zeste n=1 Tax=Romanomermis culicivorax TaxID=13658 RepID=A0A915IGY3_ROMCU
MPNWTPKEELRLREICLEYRLVLDSAHRNSDTTKKKVHVWKIIEAEVNAQNPDVRRSLEDIKIKWKNLKSRAKEDLSDAKKSVRKRREKLALEKEKLNLEEEKFEFEKSKFAVEQRLIQAKTKYFLLKLLIETAIVVGTSVSPVLNDNTTLTSLTNISSGAIHDHTRGITEIANGTANLQSATQPTPVGVQDTTSPLRRSLFEEYEYNQALSNLVSTIGRVLKSELSKSAIVAAAPPPPNPQLSYKNAFDKETKVLKPGQVKSLIKRGRLSSTTTKTPVHDEKLDIKIDDEKIVTIRPLPTNVPAKIDSRTIGVRSVSE